MMWETADVLALIFGTLGLIGGVIGFFRSTRASKRAERASNGAERASARAEQAEAAAQDARSDAAAALLRSADANERIATAIEIISGRSSAPTIVESPATSQPRELRALIPAPVVRWIIEERSEKDSYRLRNDGTIAAREVSVAAVPQEHSTLVRMDADLPSLEPGSAVVVRTERRLSLSVKELEITWRDDRSPESRRASLYLP